MKHLVVHLAITECNGTVPMLIELIDLDGTVESIIHYPGTVHSLDPVHPFEFDFSFPNVVIEHAGVYVIKFSVESWLIAERRLTFAERRSIDEKPD